MSQDLTTTGGREAADSATTGRPPMDGPMFEGRRALGPGAAQGIIAVESERAIAEAQAAMVVAQRFPRDENAAYAKAMDAAKRPSLAAQALYSYKRGSEAVEGLSIRAAEELARIWGNFTYGMLELNQHAGSSEYQAFAHDLESNVRTVQNFTVNHIRDTRQGAKQLTDQRDIYETGANMGARRMRARILALLPSWLVDDFEQAIRKTRQEKDSKTPLPDLIRQMAAYAQGIGVSTAMLEARLGHKLEVTQLAEIQMLRGVFTALKDSQTTIADEFATNAEDAGKPLVDGAKPEPKADGKKPAAQGQAAQPPQGDAAKDPPKADPAKAEAPKDPPKAEAPKADAPKEEAKPVGDAEIPAQESQEAAEATTPAANSAAPAGDAAAGPGEGDMF